MSDLDKIVVNETEYSISDSTARADIQTLNTNKLDVSASVANVDIDKMFTEEE